jgi:capsid protein
VIHVFREDRPGQHRGIPELTPALPLFSQLRRFTLATLAAAETAAEFAAVIETTRSEAFDDATGGNTGDDEEGKGVVPEPMDVFELAQRMVTVLPDGYKINQVKPEHPATTYGEFKREILAEAFAAVVMPYAVGANDSKEYNFASGKLDRRGYAKAVTVERSIEWDSEVFRILYAWYLEAKLVRNYLPAVLPPFQGWGVQIFWDEVDDDIDPTKAATAREIELRSGQTSYFTLYARKGLDATTEMQAQADVLGLSLQEYRRRLVDKLFGNGNTITASSTPVTDDNADKGAE